MRKSVNSFCLLFLILLFTKGHHGFFIKHSSGLCLQAESQYWYKGRDTGPITSQYGPKYRVYFQNTCLHDNAQFRFFEPFSVLHNIEKNGTFLAAPDKSSYKNQFIIYHSPHPKVASTYIYSAQFALKQTSAGSLKLNNGYCPTPVKPGTYPKGPLIPINGSEVYHTNRCDQEEQKFVFGSVTCDGQVTTDVNCHHDQVMVIQNAIFGGRPDMKTCGYNEDKNNCFVSATCLVETLCNGKQNCSGITVQQNMFNIDPCRGIPKYLYFEYTCANTTEPVKQLSVTDVRLSFSLLPNEGFLEIKINNVRRKVCNTILDNRGKAVVCRQLGYKGVKQHNPSPATYHDLSSIFSGDIGCYGSESALTQCCVNNAAKDEDCASVAYVACSICSEPLLENRANFSDSIFSASGSTENHTPAKARLSSNSSWCAPSNGVNYLDIELDVIYVINSLTIFGDAVTANWVTLYKLDYTDNKINWMEGQIGDKLITGNTDGFNTPATITLGELKAQVLRIIPITSNGEPCMRIEICGHTLFPDQVQDLNIKNKTSTTVSFSWNPPVKDGDKALSEFRIKILKKNSVVRNFTVPKSNSEENTIKDLSPYTEYDLSVSAGNVHGFGKERSVKFTTDEDAPSGSPRDVTVIAQSSSSLLISWKEPEKDKQNGIITNYTVCISYVKDRLCFQKLTIVKKSLLILKLNDFTKYFVKVLASTKAGSGNYSESKKRFTNAQPLEASVSKTSNTLTFILEIPSGNYSYFQVIALKLSNGKTPSSSPDGYTEIDLLSYAEAKNSPQPKPYIAAVFEMSNKLKKEFKLGDGKTFSLLMRRRRRSTSVVYYNGPLEPGTSYSVFQRVYKDQYDYFSTGWSTATRTNPTQTTSEKCCNNCGESSKSVILYIVIAILVVIIAVLIGILVYVTVCRPRAHTPTTKVKVVTSVDNKSFSASGHDTPYEVPLSSMGKNHEDNSSQYQDLQNRGNDQDEHIYQSLPK